MHGHLNVKFTVTHFIDSLPQSTYQLTSASLLATNTAKFALSKFNVTPVLKHSFNLTVTSLSKYQKKKGYFGTDTQWYLYRQQNYYVMVLVPLVSQFYISHVWSCSQELLHISRPLFCYSLRSALF